MLTKSKEAGGGSKSKRTTEEARNPQATRETVESIVVAVILAFLFRAFIAEAFVIPTGSMAPTLQGRHMDVKCSECGYQYRTGASGENPDSPIKSFVEQTTCPICRFPMQLQKKSNANHRSFNGDRILVSKFAYVLGEPKRWDVIVFKYPGNAKQNYIKRLVGLPGESIIIHHGDIYTKPSAAGDRSLARIERKPPEKVAAMLQTVHDTKYESRELEAVKWPSRWEADSAGAPWKSNAGEKNWHVTATSQEAWLRYRHLIPWSEDWPYITNGELPSRLGQYKGQLITDYYEYNDNGTRGGDAEGLNWVGDLALECDVELKQAQGELLLDLVEGGTHFGCRIDLATGAATLSITGAPSVFSDDAGKTMAHPVGETGIQAAGRYRLRYANVDDRILLWVGGKLIDFNGPTTYSPSDDVVPHWSDQDAGDLKPIGIGARGTELQVNRLRVLRDVYYIAVGGEQRHDEYRMSIGMDSIRRIMASPETWGDSALFDSRRSVEFKLAADHFFPMGDNSPQSKDARLWSEPDSDYREPPPYVERRLLIGKALLIYWPHPWRGPFGIPLIPNFRRMGLIH